MLDATLVGRRVVIRYDRSTPLDGRPPLSDLVGELLELTEEKVTVATRRGPVTVHPDQVVTGRAVQASRRDVLDLERISRRGWRAAEVVELDGWLLCADRGWTGRANSVLPLRTPTRPLARLLAEVTEFYTDRGLATQIQLPLPARELLDADLADRGWNIQRPTVVLTRPVEDQPPPPDHLSTRPSPAWLAGYHYRGGALPDHAEQLLVRHDTVAFLSVSRDGRQAGIARGTVDEGWLGVTAVEVDPAVRRTGVAGELMRLAMSWGAAAGAQSCFLQVDAGNTAALALYRRLGFTEHHRYHYRLAPTG